MGIVAVGVVRGVIVAVIMRGPVIVMPFMIVLMLMHAPVTEPAVDIAMRLVAMGIGCAEHQIGCDLALNDQLAVRGRIDALQACFYTRQTLRIGQIAFGDQHAIGRRQLLDRFGIVLKGRQAVDGIQRGHHAVQCEQGRDHPVIGQSLDDRGRIGQPRGLDGHPRERRQQALLRAAHQIEQSIDQIAAHRAADAAVLQHHRVFNRLFDQQMINRDFPEFIDDHRRIRHIGCTQHMVEHGGFATAQKPRQNGDGDGCGGGC